MLCTKCSNEIEPIVAIDIDGTLGDYHSHMVKFFCGYFGREVPEGWTGDPPDWEEYLGLTKAEYREGKLAFRQGGLKRTMPMFPGASALTWQAHAQGAEVWITTTRPWQRLDSVDPDTREWLSRNDIYFDHLLYDEHKYHRLAELVDPDRVIFVLDDLPDMYSEADSEFSVGVTHLIRRRHNSAHPRSFVITGGLQEALTIAERKIRNWRSVHG